MNKQYELEHLLQFGSYLQDHPEIVDLFKKKSRFIRAIRNHLTDIGAFELEMPCLQTYREGAPVHQFFTTHPLTGERFYLRHCMEDHLRRVCRFFGQVFELGKGFRVEVEDNFRANEFTVMEYVGEAVTYTQGLEIVKNLVANSVQQTFGTLLLDNVDFREISTITFDDLMWRVLGYGIFDPQFKSKSVDKLCEIGVNISSEVLDWEVYEELLKHYLEPSLIHPTLIIQFPMALQHVAEIDPEKKTAKRFSLIVNGIEICDGGVKFNNSELYQTIYQRNAEYRKANLDIDDNDLPHEFFEDIDRHKSNVFTFGLGVDRLFAICTVGNIHEVILFPHH